MKSTVTFRVDATVEIGYGHLTRCLTLADALNDLGLRPHFVLRGRSKQVAEMVRQHGCLATFLTTPIPAPTIGDKSDRSYMRWLGVPWLEDARQTVEAVAKDAVRCVVVDHFGLDYRWEAYLRQATAAAIMVIDGQANRRHDCELLLDQTYSEESLRRWDGLVPSGTRFLAGPKYALLRPEFDDALSLRQTRFGEVRRILIAFGGSDPLGVTGLALEAVLSLGRSDLTIDVVAGAANPWAAQLRKRCAETTGAARFHLASTQMASLMAHADLSIGAGGMMMWERAFLGLPAVVVSVADNQTAIAERVAATGAIVHLGPVEDLVLSELRLVLAELIGAPEQVRKMVEESRNLMGERSILGTHIVAQKIFSLKAGSYTH